MPLFPSPEWMDAFCVELRAHPRALELAEALDGVYRFVVEPAGPLAERHSYDVRIRPEDSGASAERISLDGQPRLALSADYERWRQLITGKLDVGMAIMLRRIRVNGDLSALIGRVSSARPLMEALAAVETRWQEERR